MPKSFLPWLCAAALAVLVWDRCADHAPVQVLSALHLASIPVAKERTTLDTMLHYDPVPGTVFFVPDSSRVKVIDRQYGCLLVEMVGGPEAGRRGWVAAGWVSPK